jgi:hypothetical protein
MTPPALLAMIFDRARTSALGAFNLMVDRPFHVDLNQTPLHAQLDICNQPWRHETQQ